ncbi:MAG: hypothetical protein ACD_15C00031G0011 [uncultured bacterium]|nr:MAG: hypothetical protein ACD_15C00031G0011 [uncultured bacterium]HCU71008.1 hypothetical protein [Candidatus Moranbacteria bacterium]
MSEEKFFGSQKFYDLLQEGEVKECQTIIVVDGREYKYELGGMFSLVHFDKLTTKPEWILEGKEWYIKK